MNLLLSQCPHCSSERIVRNGSVKGRPRYRCQSCGKSGYVLNDRSAQRLERHAHIEALLTERLSLRAVARMAKVTHTTVARVLKKRSLPPPVNAND